MEALTSFFAFPLVCAIFLKHEKAEIWPKGAICKRERKLQLKFQFIYLPLRNT